MGDERIASTSSSKPREYLEVRGRKISYLLAVVYFREMLVSFSAKDVRACPLLHTDAFMAW
jgi:hypothetical protein